MPTRARRSIYPTGIVPNCLAYTGTHDNDTTYGWYHTNQVTTTQPRAEVAAARAFALRYAHTTADEVHWGLIRMILGSIADTAIIPMQDILGLDSRARMNFPGKAEGNWRWRYRKEQLDGAIRDRLADLTATYSRWNGAIPTRWDPRYRPPQKDEG